jgi:sodium-dependent dicarboxylate transporter 2/3/5
MAHRGAAVRAYVALAAGAAFCFAPLVIPPPAGMSPEAWRATGVGLLMATWWITEVVPIPVTALLPLVLFPVLGILTIDDAASPYANPVIFLFLGGFIIARALEQSGLHKRIALTTIGLVGTRPANLVGGFMVATAFISLWVSNTATMLMMYPMATSVIAYAERDTARADPRFATTLILGIAFAASIGGVGTIIGTPPNALLAGFLSETYGREIGFAQWMLLGVPVVLCALPLTWLVLVRWPRRLSDTEIAGGGELFRSEAQALGPMSRAEWTAGAITTLTAICWIARPLIGRVVPGLSDTGIAIFGAVLMFLVPVTRHGFTPTLRWDEAERIPWSVLILFGGGLSLADALSTTGVATWLGNAMAGFNALPTFAVIALITTAVLVLSELASNTATAAVFLPIAASMAVGMNADPLTFAIPAALAASCGFMLPVGTPPNAIAFASGRVTTRQMVVAGVWVDMLMLVLINLLVFLLAGRIFGAS